MAGRKRILLVYAHYSSFVRNDHDILATMHDVERFEIGWHDRVRDRIRATHLALRRAIHRNDQVFWWFLSDYAATGLVLARLAGKRFVGVAGGWDVAREPEVGYGRLLAGPVQRTGTKWAVRHADLVLTVSPQTHEKTLQIGRRRETTLVPNGVDVDRFRPAPPKADHDGRPMVVAVGAINKTNHDVKGQWVFAEASKRLPEADFHLIGSAIPEVAADLVARGGPNLHLAGPLGHDVLPSVLQRAQVVCQLSWCESFGMGLVEAVACGAAPVISQDRIGAAAYLDGLAHGAPYGDVPAVVAAIRRALGDAQQPGYRELAHQVIRRNLSLARRKAALLEIMAEG